jgi:hypothetical protein
VDVVRHDDVTVDVKQILLAGLFQDFYESVASFYGAENISFPGATESNEV